MTLLIIVLALCALSLVLMGSSVRSGSGEIAAAIRRDYAPYDPTAPTITRMTDTSLLVTYEEGGKRFAQVYRIEGGNVLVEGDALEMPPYE